MTSKTFVSGTVIDSAWLNDVNAATYGSGSIYTPPNTGAVPTTAAAALNWNSVNVFRFMTTAQIADVQANSATLDMTTPIATAIAVLVVLGGGDLITPRGTYLLNGVAGSDTYKNGILLPNVTGDFTTHKGIRIVGEGVDTIFKAGSTGMIVLRHSRLYSGGENFKIDGGGLSNVIGRAIAPESLTQTTTVVSQSFAIYRNVHIENCTEGDLFQPGPTITGTDSGGFYHRLYDQTYNNNTRDIWMKKDATGSGNRTTRTSFYGPVFMRGNTGVQIDGGTEIDFYSPSFEMINTGVTPSATPTAFNYNDSNPANIRIFGGYAEACTKALVALHPQAVQTFGFTHNSVKDASEYSMGKHDMGALVISKNGNAEARQSFGYAGFVDLIVDPDQTGAKTLALQLNGTDKQRWNAAGSKTFYGSLGNITTTATGDEIAFSKVGASSIRAAIGGSLNYYGDMHLWSSASNVLWATLTGTEFIPRIDNALTCGGSGFRWSAVWAANGTIQTSDPRTKKDIIDSPLGLDFIMKLKPVAYKFIVGGNKVVGERMISPAVFNEQGEETEHAVVEPLLEIIPGKRQHFGFLTTDVKVAMGEVDFGGFIKTDVNDADSEEALRYEEFIAPLVRAVQELSSRVITLEGK